MTTFVPYQMTGAQPGNLNTLVPLQLIAPQVSLNTLVPFQLVTGGATDYNEASYGTRGGALTGLVNGKKLTISAWVHFKARNGNLQMILSDATTEHWSLRRTASNKFQFALKDNGNNTILSLISASSFYSSSDFYHVIVSVDLAVAGSARMYVNDVLEAGPTTGTDNNILLVDTDYYIGRTQGSTPGILLGCLAEVFVQPDYIDLSVGANRLKFRTAVGFPADLGNAGQLPFGTAPLIYMPKGNPTINVGTGGNYVGTGTFPVCAHSPGQVVTESVGWNQFDILNGTASPVVVYSQNNRTITQTASNQSISIRATGGGWTGKTSGKIYWELAVVGNVGGAFQRLGSTGASLLAATPAGAFYINEIGQLFRATAVDGAPASTGITLASAPSSMNTFGFAVDLDADKVWISINGAYVLSGNPAAGTNHTCTIPAGAIIWPFCHISAQAGVRGNYKSADLVTAPPAGFSAWDQT